MFFQAFSPKDLDAMREDHDLIDKWVEGEERCTASIDVDTAWDVLRHILDEAGFRSDGVADGVLSNGCDFVSPELVKEQAKELATWSRARVREALRAIDEDAGLYHQAVSTSIDAVQRSSFSTHLPIRSWSSRIAPRSFGEKAWKNMFMLMVGMS